MKKLNLFCIAFLCLFFISFFSSAQNTKKTYRDTTVIREANDPFLIKKNISAEKYVDFFFFNGDTDVVAFQLNENGMCRQFIFSGKDSSAFCFTISANAFDSIMTAMYAFKKIVEDQTTQAVKCTYCSTLQLFWYDDERERSVIKRAYNIPVTVNTILDFCYDKSVHKEACPLSMSDFKCFQGFESLFRQLNN